MHARLSPVVIGRKWVVIFAGLIWIVGCILQGTAHNTPTLIAGRVISGISVGMRYVQIDLLHLELK